MARFAYLIAGLFVLCVFVASVAFVQSQRGSFVKRKYPWVSYLLIWPVLLDTNKRAGRFLTNREWLGWLVVAVLIACGIFWFH